MRTRLELFLIDRDYHYRCSVGAPSAGLGHDDGYGVGGAVANPVLGVPAESAGPGDSAGPVDSAVVAAVVVATVAVGLWRFQIREPLLVIF